MIEQQMGNLMAKDQRFATILTQIEVDPDDPAFDDPTKFIGPVYTKDQADELVKERGWVVKQDGPHWRRVVASPLPKRIFEINVIRMLIEQDVIVICAGGGGIPTKYLEDGTIVGVEAVIDKDRAAGLLAREVQAEYFLVLTDVDAVYLNWGKDDQKAIRRASPNSISKLGFPAGSMGPKVEAACEFARGSGGIACIGSLKNAREMLAGEAGTAISSRFGEIEYA
jgi:carbamate kinase